MTTTEPNSYAEIMRWCIAHRAEIRLNAAHGNPQAVALIEAFNAYHIAHEDDDGTDYEAALRSAVAAYREATE